MKSSARPALLAIAFLLSAILPATLPARDSPDSVLRGTKQFSRRVLATGLANPWEITWGPDNMLWVTERTGKRIVRIDPETGNRTVAISIPEVSAPGGQDGLLGIALSPDILKTTNNYLYAAYTYVDKTRTPNAFFPTPPAPITSSSRSSYASPTTKPRAFSRIPQSSSPACPLATITSPAASKSAPIASSTSPSATEAIISSATSACPSKPSAFPPPTKWLTSSTQATWASRCA